MRPTEETYAAELKYDLPQSSDKRDGREDRLIEHVKATRQSRKQEKRQVGGRK